MKLLWIFVIGVVLYDSIRSYKIYREAEEEEKGKALYRFFMRIGFLVLAILVVLFGEF